MKRIYLHILTAAVAASTLAACDKEDAEPKAVRDYPSFSATIEGAGTRAFDTSWEENDAIGITVGSGSVTGGNVTGGGASNLSFTHQGNGRFTVTNPSNQIVFADDNQVHFTAYYPYTTTFATSGTNKGKIVYSGASNYIKQDNQKKFDFLWAEAYGSKEDPDVKFNFVHKMSKLSFVFINGEDMDVGNITSYSANGLILEGTFNPADGTCATTTTTTKRTATVTPTSKVENGKVAPPMILFPHKLKGDVKLTINVPNVGIDPITLLSTGDTLLSGKNYQFHIKVSSTKMTVTNLRISDWTTEDRGDTWEAW